MLKPKCAQIFERFIEAPGRIRRAPWACRWNRVTELRDRRPEGAIRDDDVCRPADRLAPNSPQTRRHGRRVRQWRGWWKRSDQRAGPVCRSDRPYPYSGACRNSLAPASGWIEYKAIRRAELIKRQADCLSLAL